jgi:hypothetical protein
MRGRERELFQGSSCYCSYLLFGIYSSCLVFVVGILIAFHIAIPGLWFMDCSMIVHGHCQVSAVCR